tara:strand:- start:28259 stop:29746 length:1488 start_codon:yes stop_codon:yes gene_type:complete
MATPFFKLCGLLSALAFVYISTPQVSDPQTAHDRKYPDIASSLARELGAIYRERQLYGDFGLAIVDEKGLVRSVLLNRDLLEGNPSILSNDSPIYIASHTKSFTATLLKILEEKGKLDLNASLFTYLPELHYLDSVDTQKITIKSLLNHTHGTFGTRFAYKTAFLGYKGGNDELINDLNTDFKYDPSHVFRYSNVGPIIAALVAERATGNSWKEEMGKELFGPLEMVNSSAKVSDYPPHSVRPSVTTTSERGIVHTGFYKEDITMHASGGIISSLADLSKWLSANIRQDDGILSKTAWKELHNVTTDQDKDYFTYHRYGYSLGWDLAEYQGDTLLTRFGGLAGISFHISFMPRRKMGIIAFSTDNRAYNLPHLMADYAYNQLNSKVADSLFKAEKQLFEKSFELEDNIVYPKKSDLWQISPENDRYLGLYQNSSGWPHIKIGKNNDRYTLKWGVLQGDIHTGEDAQTASLGVFDRNFTIKNDTLITGSLIYVKKK